jgi:methylated-DNA-[protein]-cysteine S-methyltransferase
MSDTAVVDLPVLGRLRLVAGPRGLRQLGLGLSRRIAPVAPAAIHRPFLRVLERWIDGQAIPDDLALDVDGLSEFQHRVLAATRAIPWGRTVSYGELATAVGSSGAARAVGGVMARNPLPVVIPCHRVVAANGVGGFSCGLALKRAMWAVEGIPWPTSVSAC